MEPDFWHQRWASKEIGFHEEQTNTLLIEFSSKLGLKNGQRIFVPLCGKTNDIAWLLKQGYQVVGAELSELAIQELFDSLSLKPEITESQKLKKYSAKNIIIFVGDIFDLDKNTLGQVHAIYDRAALVALPEAMRIRYAKLLVDITGHSPQLLITLEYNLNELSGPPFSLNSETIESLYSRHYQLKQLKRRFLEKGLKGSIDVFETASLLTI